MSDYLWDKTGEPEADVAELENLLGALKYKQRPLEIPAAAIAPTTTKAARTRPATIFSRPRLALAASLLLTLLAGAWFVAHQTERQPDHIATIKPGSEQAGTGQPEKAVAGNAETGSNASGNNAAAPKQREDKTSIVTASAPKTHRAPRGVMASNGATRRTVARLPPEARNQVAQLTLQPGVTRRGKVQQTRESVAANGGMRWQVEQPLTPQQREATEQLMLALRLASAKLNYAQREMQEIGRSGK